MAAHTRGKVAWDQTSTLGRHSGRVAVGERGRHMKDVDFHRRQLQQQLQALDDEYQRLGNQEDEQAWNLSDEEPRSLQVITQPTPAPGSSSPGTNKRASWAGYDDKAKQNYYGTGPGAVGTMPRTRTSLVDYKMDPADRFKVDIDVKEFNPEDVRIKLEEDGGVCVEAKREDADKSGRLSTLERRSKVKLPHEVDRSRLSAIFSADDGVLTIQAPKRASGTSSPSSLGPQSPNYNIPNSPPGQTILVQPSTPIPPQTDIPYADEPPPSFGQYPMYDSPYNREGSVPVSSPQVIPYYIDRDPPLRQTRSPSPTKRDPIRPSHYQGHPSTSPAYSPRPDHQHNRILYPEPLYTPPRKAHKPQQQQPKTSTPTSNKIILKPAIKDSQSPSPRRGRPATEASPASPRSRSSPMPHEKVRSTSLPRQRPAQVQHENISPPEKSDSLPPPMGRMTISFTLGRGFTPDQVIVKNIMNYNKFMVLAKADGYSGRKSFRHIFSWPCPINPATIYAYLKKDGVLHVSSMPLCGPE